MSSVVLDNNMRSAIRPRRNRNAREQRLLSLQEDYQIPLVWAEKLPVKQRKWTDCCCLIIFLLVCLAMIGTTIFIFLRSDHQQMFKLYDSSGNDCGVGDAKDYPYLYMQNFKSPYKSVCVKECPQFDYNQIRYNADGSFEPISKSELDDGTGRLLEETTETNATTTTTQETDGSTTTQENSQTQETDGSTTTTTTTTTTNSDSTEGQETPKSDSPEESADGSPEEEEPRPPLDKDGKLVPMYFKEFNLKHAGRSVTHTRTPSDEEIFGYDKGFANGFYTEENFEDYMTNHVSVDCFENGQVSSCKYKPGEFWVYDSYPVLGIVCAPLSPKPSLFFFRISSRINHGAMGDLLESWKVFMYVALISLAVALVFLILTRFCGKWIVIILAIVTTLALITLGTIIILNYTMPEKFGTVTAHLHMRYKAFLLRNKVLLLIIASACIVAAFIFACILCRFRKELSLAYPVLEIAAKCSITNILLVILSIFIVFVQISVILFEIYVMLRLYTMGEEVNDKAHGSPFVSYKLEKGTFWLLALHIIGTYWIVIFLNNFNDFINSSVTVNYYFDTKLKNLNIFCHTLGHNCGSVAWTIVLLPVLVIKLLFAPFKWLVTSEEPNKCQNCFQKACNCCCACYESLFDCISEGFMCLTYMGSENFNVATRRYYYLTELYLDESSTVSILGTIYNMLGRIIITAIGGYCGVLIIQGNDELEQNVKYVGLIFFLCFAISFVLGSLLINIFSTAYDTLFICFLTEKNIYDQLKKEGTVYDLQAKKDIEEAFLKIINDSNDYQRLNEGA